MVGGSGWGRSGRVDNLGEGRVEDGGASNWLWRG